MHGKQPPVPIVCIFCQAVLYYNTYMETPRAEMSEERKDYTEDPQYRRNLRKWNMAQIEEMQKPETREKIAEWKVIKFSEVTKEDMTVYWAEEGSKKWREEHKYDPDLFDYIGDERAAA